MIGPLVKKAAMSPGDSADSENCWNDYSIYKTTNNIDDIFEVCSPPEAQPVTETRSQCGWWNSSDWKCMSNGTRVGVVVILIIVGAIIISAIGTLLSSAKKATGSNMTNPTDAYKQDSYERTPDNSPIKSVDYAIREKLAILERLDDLIDESTETTFVAKPDEQIMLIASGVHLVEPRKGPSRFRGSSSGVTVRLTKRVSVRSGAFSGESTPTAQVPTLVDQGQFVVTTQRCVFLGPKETREFSYEKLLGINRGSVDKSNSVLYLPVSNRKSVSGVGSGNSSIDVIQGRIALAVELRSRSKEQLIAELKERLS